MSVERTFSVEDIKPPIGSRPRLVLGKMGLESNLAGDCSLSFSTLNTFKLRHIVSNKRLSRYNLYYKGQKITKNNNTMILPCTSRKSNLKFKSAGRFLNNVKSGIYRDTVTIVVTTE